MKENGPNQGIRQGTSASYHRGRMKLTTGIAGSAETWGDQSIQMREQLEERIPRSLWYPTEDRLDARLSGQTFNQMWSQLWVEGRRWLGR